MTAFEWDAGEYEVLASPHVGWGVGLLERAFERWPLAGDERAMDAGCGTGRVTELLLERLPRGTVLAVDGSAAMVEAAGEKFAGDGRVRVERRDLLELGIEGGFDLILSTATFHWIPDHDRLFLNLARALEPGGRLVAQCGGAGNISRVTRAIEEVASGERYRAAFDGWGDDKEYASAETTDERLERAGFRERETWLHDELTPFESVEDLARYLKTVVLGRHLQRLPKSEHEPFAAAVARRVADYDAGGPPVMDYVRLNILARKPPA